jgi:hypothetical protein
MGSVEDVVWLSYWRVLIEGRVWGRRTEGIGGFYREKRRRRK